MWAVPGLAAAVHWWLETLFKDRVCERKSTLLAGYLFYPHKTLFPINKKYDVNVLLVWWVSVTQDHSSLKWTSIKSSQYSRATTVWSNTPVLFSYGTNEQHVFRGLTQSLSYSPSGKWCTWYVHKLFPLLFESLCQINCSHSKSLNKRHGTKCPCLLRCGATALNSSCRLLSFSLFFFFLTCNLCVTVYLDHTGHNVPTCHGFQLAKTNYINMGTLYTHRVPFAFWDCLL